MQSVSDSLKLNQIIGIQCVENTISKERCCNKNSCIMDHNESKCIQQKMNFKSSVVMTTFPALVEPEFQTLRIRRNTDKMFKDDNTEPYSMRNIDTHNLTSFDSVSTINCSTNGNHIKGEINEKFSTYNSTSNAAHKPVYEGGSQERPNQIFGTKVTRLKIHLLNVLYFLN